MYKTGAMNEFTQPIDGDKYVMNLGNPYEENNDLNGLNLNVTQDFPMYNSIGHDDLRIPKILCDKLDNEDSINQA